MNWINTLINPAPKRELARLGALTAHVNRLEGTLTDLSDDELKQCTWRFRQQLADGTRLDDLAPEALAVAREAARRQLGQRAYDVQIMGAGALLGHNITQMGTGEGKTLVAAIASYLQALAGDGVHIVTVNDYLAARDAEWMGRVQNALAITVGVIHPGMPQDQRKAAYQADITYGTNNEFGFDYLRDNMTVNPTSRVQRGHEYAIIDEADSILIDEARTPLIISGVWDANVERYTTMAGVAARLQADRDYEIDPKKRTIGLLDGAIDATEAAFGIEHLYTGEHSLLISMLTNALKAKDLYRKDREYVIVDQTIKLIDQHTGRVMEGRRYSDGLHQAIEAKERLPVRPETRTMATVTLQNYFRMYRHLSGMTGTAASEAKELAEIYQLGVVEIPPHRPSQRVDQQDLVYRTRAAKLRAVVDDITRRHTTGQPVLVGTTSISQSEELSSALETAGIPHQVLNAKQHAQEAAIIADAGKPGAVTVSTNMAGRGTDIILGGHASSPEEREHVNALGGLYVIGTERHESRRIDDQLRGRAGRQGDHGETRFYLSLEDDLVKRFKADMAATVMKRVRLSDDTPIDVTLATRSIASAQRQVESMHYDTRKNLVRYDDILNTQRELIYQQRQQIVESSDNTRHIAAFARAITGDWVNSVHGTDGTDVPDEAIEQLLERLETVWPVNLDRVQIQTAIGDGNLDTLLEAALENCIAQRTEQLGQAAETVATLVLLDTIDQHWRDHLVEMTHLRDGIGLRAMARRDPIVEYRNESRRLYADMVQSIRAAAVAAWFNAAVNTEPSLNNSPASVTYIGPNENGEPQAQAQTPQAANGGSRPVGRRHGPQKPASRGGRARTRKRK